MEQMLVSLMNRNLNMHAVDYDFEMPYYMEKMFEFLEGKEIQVYDYWIGDNKHKKIGILNNFVFDGDKITATLTFSVKRNKKYINEINKNKRLFSGFSAYLVRKDNGVLEVYNIENFESYVFGVLQRIEKVEFEGEASFYE